MSGREQAGPLPTSREPMDASAVRRALLRPERWQVVHVRETGSTNDDLTHGSGAVPDPADGTVLVTEEQTAGRGRSGRQWSCPPGAGLMFSVRVSLEDIPPQRRAWVGVALGLAVVQAFGTAAGVAATLKWPNDVLIDGAKCGGILAESVGASVVVGAGLNISVRPDELPRSDATSLLAAGGREVDRDHLLAAVLDSFGDLLDAWRAAAGDVDAGGLRARYLASCSTIGTDVTIELPGGRQAAGVAVDVDPGGAVVILGRDGTRSRFSAGDVVHLRPAR